MMIQQSNYFIVVERGVGYAEHACRSAQLAGAGQRRDGLEHGRRADGDGRLRHDTRASCFPKNAGGIGGAVGSMFGRGAAASRGGLKFKEAQTSMLMADARSGVQVARRKVARRRPTSGSAPAFRRWRRRGKRRLRQHNEGKIIAAAFLDNYKKVVKVIRNDPRLQRNVGTLKQEAAAGARPAGRSAKAT